MQSSERKVPLTYQWVGDMLLNEFLESIAGGDEASRQTPALVFCFNRDMCWNVAEQVKGKRLMQRRPAEGTGDRAGPVRLVPRCRAEAAAIAAARRGSASCRRAAEVQADRGGPVSAQVAVADHLHGNAVGRDQPAGPQRRDARAAQGAAGREEGHRSEQRAPDLRPCRPAAIRQRGLCLRAGPRGRRQDAPVAREIRQHSRRHQGPQAASGEEGVEEEDAQAAAPPSSTGRRPNSTQLRASPPGRCPAAARSPGDCWPTGSMPPPKWTRSANSSASG